MNREIAANNTVNTDAERAEIRKVYKASLTSVVGVAAMIMAFQAYESTEADQIAEDNTPTSVAVYELPYVTSAETLVGNIPKDVYVTCKYVMPHETYWAQVYGATETGEIITGYAPQTATFVVPLNTIDC